MTVRAVFWVLIPVMGFLILVLALNIFERDDYAFGTEVPSADLATGHGVLSDDPTLLSLFPEKYVHHCPSSGSCEHPVEVAENERFLFIDDHDGWYRLFWSASDGYTFMDPVHLAAAYRNPTAERPMGKWTVKVKIGSASDPSVSAHECGMRLDTVTLTYALVTSQDVIERGEPENVEGGFPLQSPVPMLTYQYDHPDRHAFLHYGWALVERSASSPPVRNCEHGKP